MPDFLWEDRYSVENDFMDNQHKDLIGKMNEFHNSAEEKDWDKCSFALKELTKLVVDHFKDEELIMEKAGFQMIETHKIIHQQLIKKATELFEGFYAEPDEHKSKQINMFLGHWLASHICGLDMMYKEDMRNVV